MKALAITCISVALLAGSVLAGTSAESSRLSPGLAFVLDGAGHDADSLINVVVFLEDRSALDNLIYETERPNLSRADRIKTVLNNLTNHTAVGSYEIESYLTMHSTTPVERHWIVPSYSARIPATIIGELAAMPTVRKVVENADLSFDSPVERESAPGSLSGASAQLDLLNVRSLWQRGLTGRGRLVCSFDTGIEGTHPALASKWRGNTTANTAAWYSPVNPTSLPYDAVGHGTHTMGTMVGSTDTDTIGVAYEAEWISAGVIDQGRSFSTTISDILGAFEWVLNPDGDTSTTDDVPDVILNSWGVPTGVFAACDETFWAAIDAVEAAGIVTIFAAGNEGPDAGTIRNPADRASGPLNSFSVGAVDNNKVVAAFSSRGPSSCGGAIKPEVVAPGVSVWSSTSGGTYAYMSGTSMAAPYIAGLVALCRQYNPEATVSQIKNALMMATEDLGATGEDNAYGHGLVDASRILEYLPIPGGFDFSVAGTEILQAKVADPGDDVTLRVTLTNSAANIDQMNGRLISTSPQAVVDQDMSSFFFGTGGSTAINYTPYEITLDDALEHGTLLTFTLCLEATDGEPVDSLDIELVVGYEAPGSVSELSTDDVTLTVSDFGQFGFAPGSIYNLGADGFTAYGSDNALYEAGIFVGRSELQMSSSLRDSLGDFRPSDFTPSRALTSATSGNDGEVALQARFVDTYSAIPLPITLSQDVVRYSEPNDQGVVMLRYWLVNNSLERLTHTGFGFMSDFDLNGADESVTIDETAGIIYQGGSGMLIGLVALNGVDGFHALANGDTKSGLTAIRQFELLTSVDNQVESSTANDMMMAVTGAQVDIQPRDSIEIAFAIVVGQDVDELYANVALAREHYDIATAITDSNGSIPDSFELAQNYPNPFNPTTTISFSLPVASDVVLEVFNSLGQRVRILHKGQLPAGTHSVEWDATSDSGARVASGVYFYRLSTDERQTSRKMILLK